MVSSGVFTIGPSSHPDMHAYLPLTGWVGTHVVAPPLAVDAEFIIAEHTSVEQLIAQDVTITNMSANFGSTGLNGRTLRVELMLLASHGGTALMVPAGGCAQFMVVGNGPTTYDCDWSAEEAAHLSAGDTAVVYLHAYLDGGSSDENFPIYGSVALSL